MARIQRIRPVLLSALYADLDTNAEIRENLPSGYRTTGLVEITLDDGIVGLGEGYLAVFAPHVFRAIVDLLTPALVGRDPRDFDRLRRDLAQITGYWSLQGAAQHVISAFEIALQDCRAQLLGVSVARMLGAKPGQELRLYASGGDSVDPASMTREFAEVQALGIDLFKIRARNDEVPKAAWCERAAAARGMEIAIDMTQNLVIPAQSIADIARFLAALAERGGRPPYFLEEALGPQDVAQYPVLRAQLPQCRIAGGEIVTTAFEMISRIEQGCYDLAQPDATVIGGIGAVLESFDAARRCGTEVVVHCWGGPVGMMANFHAALAGGGQMAEWPLPRYPLRQALSLQPWQIAGGRLRLPELPGLGLRLTPEIEREFAFREDAIYRCLYDGPPLPRADWDGP